MSLGNVFKSAHDDFGQSEIGIEPMEALFAKFNGREAAIEAMNNAGPRAAQQADIDPVPEIDTGPSTTEQINLQAEFKAVVEQALDTPPPVELSRNEGLTAQANAQDIDRGIDQAVQDTGAALQMIADIKEGRTPQQQQAQDNASGQPSTLGKLATGTISGSLLGAAAGVITGNPMIGKAVTAFSTACGVANASSGLGSFSPVRGSSELNKSFDRNGHLVDNGYSGSGDHAGPSVMNAMNRQMADIPGARHIDSGDIETTSQSLADMQIRGQSFDEYAADIQQMHEHALHCRAAFDLRDEKGVILGRDQAGQALADRDLSADNFKQAASGGYAVFGNMA